jgi:hypothetical protein
MYSSSTPASSTPGRLPCRVITGGERPSAYAQFVLDPTAGNGAPMARWPRERRFAPLLGDPACSTAAACCRV